MRLVLDTASGLLLPSPVAVCALERLYRTLGDAPLEIQTRGGPVLAQLHDDGSLITAGELQLIAKESISGATIITGAAQVSAAVLVDAQQILTCGESWKRKALLNLFASPEQPCVTLQLQLRFRDGGASVWRHTRFVETIVEPSLFVEDVLPDVDTVEDLFRLPFVDSYIGSETSLEYLNGALLPDGFEFLVTIEVGGVPSASQWSVVKPAGAATNVAGGVIALLDGTAHLVRVAGL